MKDDKYTQPTVDNLKGDNENKEKPYNPLAGGSWWWMRL